jgi:pimeloyl-ACP methyl ester carboxylesterase
VISIPFTDENGTSATVEEQLCHFGPSNNLFGILSRTSEDHSRPAIVMFNSGAVHHAGPHDIYVTIARTLATLGFACFRFDLDGLGDSVLRAEGRENHPYPETATADARSALDFLKQDFGYSHFLVLGLCSGAHTSFHAALALQDHEVSELILINPLTFYWKEGMTLETTRQFVEAMWYRQSIREASRWMKLLRGEVNLRHPIKVAVNHLKTILESHYRALCEAVLPNSRPRLSEDLRKLFAMKRRVVMILAGGEPGRDILMSDARHTASKGLKSGQISIAFIPDADHTFSQLKPRRDLIRCLSAHLKPRLKPAEADSNATLSPRARSLDAARAQ